MNASTAEEASRPAGTWTLRAPAAFPSIVFLLLAGLALRVIIAYVLLPGSGFESDLGSFAAWANRMAEGGPGTFYATAGFADYPPGYLYVLWLVGALGGLLGPVLGSDPSSMVANLIKVPPILADLGVAYLLYRVARDWFRRRGDPERPALAAAALYLFNPVTIYDSALWGQVDGVGALLMLGAVVLLTRGHSEAAVGVGVVAALVKPQFGIVLVPLLAVVLLRRHLFRVGSGPRPERVPGPAREWLVEEQGPWRLVSSAAVGLVTLGLLILPFSLDLPGLLRLLASTAGGYPYLSVNAFNPWALIGSAGQESMAAGGGWSKDEVPLVGGLSGVTIGALLLAAGFLIGLLQLARRDDRRSLVLTAAFLSLCFFILPTRVHERYLFPVFAFLPLLAAADRTWRRAALLLAAASFINLHGVLTTPLYGTPNVDDLAFGAAFRSGPAVVLSTLGHVAVFLFVLWHLRPAVDLAVDPLRRVLGLSRRAPEPDPLAPGAWPAGAAPIRRPTARTGRLLGADHDWALPDGLLAWDEEAPLPGVLARRTPPAGSLAIGGAGADDAGAEAAGAEAAAAWRGSPEPWPDDEAPRPFLGGALARLRARLASRPVRVDRSPALVRESPGRLDRMDLFIVVLVVFSALTLRTWRLAEPYDMHFDEVYHARTATEFIQDWRYGMPHDIYEYTHPHVAKYLIALGLMAFGNDRVTGESKLDGPVVDATIEQRWSPPDAPAQRNGDRLYVLTGQKVEVYDLPTRRQLASVTSTATALSIDPTEHVLYLGDAQGNLSSLATGPLDALREGTTAPPDALRPQPIATVGGAVTRLLAPGNGGSLFVALEVGRVVAVDPRSGEEIGSAELDEPGGMVAVAAGERVVVERSAVPSPSVLAERLATALGMDRGEISDLLAGSQPRVTVASYLSKEVRDKVRAEIDAGRLVGVSVESAKGVAVADRSGVALLDATDATVLKRVGLPDPATGLAYVTNVDKPTLYVASGRMLETVVMPEDGEPSKDRSVPMPGTVRDVRWDAATQQIHALGVVPHGADSTIYVVEPHANAVYADAKLPFVPRAWVLDAQRDRPSDDRQEFLALAVDGRVAAVDAGSHAFAWRIPGVVAGALTAALIFLLARILFRRRSIGLIAAALVLLDGMFFANSRIAMNDTYVTLFIVAAMTVLAPLYLGLWRGRSALLLGLPAVGVLLGLALASKWVGAYAIGAVLLLVLLRSALGRLIALAGMIVLTSVLGNLALGGDGPSAQRNVLFLLIMLALTVAMAVLIAARPLRFSRDELRFAASGPVLLGILTTAAALLLSGRLPAVGLLSSRSLLLAAAVLVVVGAAVYALPRLAARFGRGPLAPPPGADDPASLVEPAGAPPVGWLRPGWNSGVPWLWALLCLTAVPLAVYVASYAPWVALGNQWLPGVPAGHTGQLFLDLQRDMYNYHNNLRAGHAASSPWWAWPFDLKPVWFFQEGFANDTLGLIYDAGNLVIFWLSVPAVAWTAWQAWRRRSPSLTFLIVAVACLWLAWSRIDRATFQYHVFTSLPFSFLCLAYFLADLWHGPSARTWALARIAGTVAVLGPPLLWLSRAPLCGLAGVEKVNKESQACGAVAARLVVTERIGLSLVVAFVGLLVIVWQARSLARVRRQLGGSGGRPVAPLVRTPGFGWLLLTVGAVVVAFLLTGAGRDDAALVSLPLGDLGPYALAGGALLLLALPAWNVLGARDSRRFVLAFLGVAALWFVLWYPNLSALPLPAVIAGAYLGLLPTYNYDFQFAVNTDAPFQAPLLPPQAILLMLVLTLTCAAAAYATRAWRVELAVRRAAAERVVRGAASG